MSLFLICQPLSIQPFIHSLPSPRLVNAFGDEVCGESVLKLLPVFERVVDLGVRHAAALKPAVKHLCDPPQDTLTTARGDCQTVNAGQRDRRRERKKKEVQLFRELATITILFYYSHDQLFKHLCSAGIHETMYFLAVVQKNDFIIFHR